MGKRYVLFEEWQISDCDDGRHSLKAFESEEKEVLLVIDDEYKKLTDMTSDIPREVILWAGIDFLSDIEGLI